MSISYTKHAREMIVFRKLDEKKVAECVNAPDRVLSARDGKMQYLKEFGSKYMKVIVANEGENVVVITVYWFAKKRLRK